MVNAQSTDPNTRSQTQLQAQYRILNSADYVNRIDFTNSNFSFYYGTRGGILYFYLKSSLSTPIATQAQVEIIFGSSKQNVYSVVLSVSLTGATYNCLVNDQFYTNGVAAPATTATSNLAPCQITDLINWSDTNIYQRALSQGVNGYTVPLDTPINIQFIVTLGGGAPSSFTYTITIYSIQYCHGICADTKCKGPEITDCTACKDPLRVALHNKCIQKLPDVLPQLGGPPPSTTIWNKLEYMNDNFNSSIYYGFRTEQGNNYCYFRVVVNQTMVGSSTPTWVGISFQNTHLTASTTPYNDMVIVYYNPAYTSSTTASPTAYDYYSPSTVNFSATTPTAGQYPILDPFQNYMVTTGGYDGVTKWDFVLVRLCNLADLNSYPLASKQAYLDTTYDLQSVYCSSPAMCTGTATSYQFSIVVGLNPWQSTITSNTHYPKITTLTYPSTSTLMSTKNCPSCYNTATVTNCNGPEQQDCTTCNPTTQQFDPRYPSTGPGICITKIIPCHADCVTQQCTTPYNNGCIKCSDPTKFLYIPSSGRCITSQTLFWNKIDLSSTQLAFYYGWDSSFEFIYFKFVGNIRGWVGVLFNPTITGSFTSKDTFYFSYSSTNSSPTIIDASCTVGTFCFKGDATNSPLDAVQAIQPLPTNSWAVSSGVYSLNVIAARQAVPTTGLGSDQAINSSYQGVTVCYDATVNTPGSATQTCLSFPTQVFYQTQQCATNCLTCSGPETTDCLTCNSNFALAGSAPNTCVGILSTGCDASCATCYVASNANKCITCTSTIQVVYKGTCISKYPLYWNKIYYTATNFTLYYGFDSTNTNIYFRITGQNSGWIGFSFMDRNLVTSRHQNTDMVTFRKSNGNMLLEDRYSLTQTVPNLDTSNSGTNDLQYIQGDRDSQGYWDLYLVRACNTGDTQGKDYIFLPNIYFTLSFAYGPNDALTGHTQYFTNTVIFKNTQICDPTCVTCSGPEVYQCTSCQTGYVLQGSSPSACVLSSTVCYQTCATCTGTTVSSCITCTNPSYISANGLCISSTPAFWNKIPITGTSLNFYYGYDMSLSYIYFRLKGTGPSGWLGMAFQSVKTQMDQIILRMVNGNMVIEDKYTSLHNYLPSDDISQGGTKDYFLVSGGRTGTNTWDVKFMRVLANSDPTFDATINTNAYTMSFAYGSSDTFDMHTAVYKVTNVYFLTKQVCDNSCQTCQGPETTDCLSCPSGYTLSSAAPSTCVNPGIVCNPNCATCSGTGQSDCLTCSSVDKISYFGNCIGKSPSVWNRIDVTSTFILYYGYDAGGSYIYFRAVGTSPGWFGVGFNGSMLNTDMHIVRVPTSTVIVEDRYSLGHVQPILDLQQNTVLISGTLVGTKLDATWVRSTISSDTTYDVPLSFDVSRTLIFAFGSTQVFNKHVSVYTMSNIIFTRTQVCYAGCVLCYGPDPSSCTQTNTTYVSTNSTVVSWISSKIIRFVMELSILVFFLYL